MKRTIVAVFLASLSLTAVAQDSGKSILEADKFITCASWATNAVLLADYANSHHESAIQAISELNQTKSPDPYLTTLTSMAIKFENSVDNARDAAQFLTGFCYANPPSKT